MNLIVDLLSSVPILSQVVKIKIEVQVSNSRKLWLYLSDANLIIKQWEEIEERIKNCECENCG